MIVVGGEIVDLGEVVDVGSGAGGGCDEMRTSFEECVSRCTIDAEVIDYREKFVIGLQKQFERGQRASELASATRIVFSFGPFATIALTIVKAQQI